MVHIDWLGCVFVGLYSLYPVPALRELLSFPGITDAIYFGLFIALAIHFDWKFGPKPKRQR
jgi:hypothetical protein